MAAVQRELDNDPTYREVQRNRKDLRSVPAAARSASGFPECPTDCPPRVWQVTEHWLACAEQAGMWRPVSPWSFARALTATIQNSRMVRKMIREHGDDVVEDLFRRMTELFWRDYIDVGTTRYQVVSLFLEDYWEDLWDQAKTQVQVEHIKAAIAAGTLKTKPKVERRSLLNDPEYQAARREARWQAYLETNPLDGDDPVKPRPSPEEAKKLLATTAEWLRADKARRQAEHGSESD